MGRVTLMDQLIGGLLDHADQVRYPLHNPTMAERLSVFAVGGYGRGELAPGSDLDLLFIYPYKPTPRIEQVIESVLYPLWDLGYKVGHAVRSVDECVRTAKEDLTVCTAVLERRLLWGERELFRQFWRTV